MPIIRPKGLGQLGGFSNLPKAEQDAFIKANEGLISSHSWDPQYIQTLYDNGQFVKKFGVDAFKSIPDTSTRDSLFKKSVIDEVWEDTYKDMPDSWKQKYDMMSIDAKQALLESNWLTPNEFEEDWNKKRDEVSGRQVDKNGNVYFDPWTIGGTAPATGAIVQDALTGEAAKQKAKEKNDRLLEHIYNDEADNKAASLGDIVGQVYNQADPDIVGSSDEDTVKKFKQAITPDWANGNPGIPEYASHYGIVEGDISSEMKDFSIDDMRQVLAKKAVYEQYMGPEMASTALNNEAKRYITDHQGALKKTGIFLNDVAIAASSYTADKVNGFYNIGLMAADGLANAGAIDKPVVYVDDKGNVLSLDDNRIARDKEGNAIYQGEDGKVHPLHQEQIDYTTLHNMGKNVGVFDEAGSENNSILNPQDWTRREQFGVWDKDLAKQYEKIGSSPYQISYNPNDDRDLLYESFKMMSFGLADGLAQLVPWGIGAVGKTLSTANNVGRVVRGLGAFTNSASKFLTAETGFGQGFQAWAGALGIAEAYQRGAFNETLAKNMENLESLTLERGKNEVYDQYHNDEKYKSQIDALIDAKAAELKANYIANLAAEGQSKVVDEEALDKMLRARAQQEVLGAEVQNRVAAMKNSNDYVAMQEEAINSAGQAATNTFWPEAIKYGLVNTFGHRRFLYSNPTSLVQKAAQNFKGLREITTSAGRQRLATTAQETLTNVEKWKKIGKFAASQAWGGAWTNGTDDMMVDAAERINEDSFGRYLDAYSKGEALADTYGFADGLFSYWTGLQNSMGQQTTAEAATVGALGSLVSGNINFANIATLATKEGRQAYRDNFQQRYERDADGMIKRDEQGNPIVKELGWGDNWRDRLGFFIQNGVLNTYYGEKQNQRDLQRHADYINNLLDQQDDFNIVRDLVASDIGTDNAENIGDKKTMRFVQAFNAIHALDQLGNSERDPAALSSIVQDRKSLIGRASRLGTEEEHDFTDEELSNLVGQYYSNNAIPESEQNTEIALQHIGQNARKMQEAYDAYNEAEENIQELEKNIGHSIVPVVRFKMKLSQALDKHWRDRIDTMKDEIGDTSSETESPTGENLIATFGGKKRSDSMAKAYEQAIIVQDSKLADAAGEAQKKLEVYQKAEQALRNAENSEASLQAQKDLKEAKDAYDDAVETKIYEEDMLSSLKEKKQRIEDALAEWEKGDKSKVLSADEIMALDPITRARMMDPRNRSLYSKQQQNQIARLEKRLKLQYPKGDALQKIQDIATLTHRVSQNEDAYDRVSRNPDAAALQMEKQTSKEAKAAYRQINERNAQTLASVVQEMTDALKVHKDVKQKDLNDLAYRMLRKMNPTLLDIVEEQGLLPDNQQQLADAKAWGRVLNDISAVINESSEADEWKTNALKAVDAIIEPANSKEEIVTRLEQAIDSNHPQAETFEKILTGMTNLGYQRNSTVLEKRKERKEREEAARTKTEEAQKKAEDAAKAAAEKAVKNAQAIEDNKATVSEEEQQKGIEEGETVALDFGEEKNLTEQSTVSQQQSPTPVVGKNTDIWQIDSDIEITKEIANSEFGESYTEAADDEFVNRIEQPRLKATADYLNGKTNDHDYLAAMGMSVGDGSWLDSPTTTKEEIAERAKKESESRKKYLKNNNDGNSFVIDNVKKGHDDTIGDYVEGHSPTAAEESQQAIDSTDVEVSNETADVETVNDNADKENNVNPSTLSGNAMAEYEADGLKEHRLEHKKGAKPNDEMNNYYTWMKNAGIKLQDIIDDELPQILSNNPHTKIKFMRTRPTPNATHDEYLKNTLLLVVDYDSKIKAVHKEDNGGVVESDGKKYLIVGTLGFGNSGLNSDRGKLWQALNTANVGHSLPTVAWKWFNQKGHEAERFYVHDGFSTEVVPGSMIPGWIIRQTETDEFPQSRRISELLNDESRNPHKLTFNTLSWSIIEYTQSLDINTKGREVMHPRNQDANAGRVFVHIPAGNGKLLAAKIDALYYNDEKFNHESELYQELQQLFMQLAAPQYKDRYDALVQLFQKLYITPEGHNILLAEDANGITFKRGNTTIRTIYTKAPSFDVKELFDAIAEWNPRINITARVLSSPKELQKYDETGALMTDLAKLGTAGVNYSVYAIDSNGDMIVPNTVGEGSSKPASDSDYRDAHRLDIPYLYGETYSYNRNSGEYTKNGVRITNPDIVTELNYARDIIDNGLSSVKTEGVWDYYVLSEGENIEVVRQSNKTKKIEKVKDEDAQNLVQELKARQEAAAREAAIQQKLEEGKEDERTVVDGQTGDLKIVEEKKESEKKDKPITPVKPASPQEGTQTFKELIRSRNRTEVINAIKDKASTDSAWSDAPVKSPSQLTEYLKSKGAQLDMIPTDTDGLKAWIHNNIVCK